jgi:hypothetical protein
MRNSYCFPTATYYYYYYYYYSYYYYYYYYYSSDHCCRGKPIRITHSESVLGKCERVMNHIANRDLFGSTLFFHIIPQTARF